MITIIQQKLLEIPCYHCKIIKMEHQNYDRLPSVRERFNQLSRRQKAAAIGSAALLALIAAGNEFWEHYNQSGQVSQSSPYPHELRETSRSLDNRFKIGNLNAYGKAGDISSKIGEYIEQNGTDAFFMQEVPEEDLWRLQYNTTGMYATFAMGDARKAAVGEKLSLTYGARGNAILTRLPPENIRTRSLNGTSLLKSALGTAEGLFVDVANAQISFEQTSENWQEDRVALAVTTEVLDGNEKKKIILATSHVAGVDEVSYIVGDYEVEKEQREELADFLRDLSKEGLPILYAGDMNDTEDVIVPWFEEMGFEVFETGPTHTNGWQRIDYVAYHPGKNEYAEFEGSAKVIKSINSDHYALEANIIYPGPDELSLKYPWSQPAFQQDIEEQLSLHRNLPESSSSSRPVITDAQKFTHNR